MKRFVATLACVLTGASCTKPAGDGVSIDNISALVSPACVVDPQATTFHSSGTRDIGLVWPDSYGYRLTPIISNRLLAQTDRVTAFAGTSNVYTQVNDMTLQGFDVCYEFRQPNEAPPPAPDSSCDDLKLKTYFIESAGIITTNGSLGVSVDIMPPSIVAPAADPISTVSFVPLTAAQVAGQASFPNCPNPAVTPTPDKCIAELAAANNVALQLLIQDARAAAIAANQANPFLAGLTKAGDSKKVIIHVRAVTRTTEGRVLKSEEFKFPVQLCVGCLNAFCAKGTDPDSLCISGQDSSGKCIQ